VFTNAVSYNNREFYISMYQGYDSGMAYFTQGTWLKILFHEPVPEPKYEKCVTTGNPKVFGYDPRCRPWYINQENPKLQPYG